jgi:N-acetylmuramoyl-L-alanine amidase
MNPIVIGASFRYRPGKPVHLFLSIDPLLRPFRRIPSLIAAALALSLIGLSAVTAAPTSAWDVLKIDGRDYVSLENVRQFYKFSKLTRSGTHLSLESAKVEVRLTVGGNECFMNNVKFVLSHPVSLSGEKLYISRTDLAKLIDPVLRPSFIKAAGSFQTVILDPGHGGKDSGATNSLGTESSYNLKLADSIKKDLQSKGFKVVMTRESNQYLSLQERVDIANNVKENAVYVSIHFNSGGRAARGIETFTLSPPGVSHYGREFRLDDNQSRAGNEHDSANIALATSVHGSILRRLGKNTFDRGIKRARFSVLTGVRHPAILLEGGFMSHPYEARLLENPAYQKALADGIVDAIRKYRFAVGGESPGPTR